MIRHISFDLWLTLIKSNPLFKQKRAEYLAENFNPRGLSAETVFNIVHKLDRACDRLNEKSGKKKETSFMYKAILKRLGYKIEAISLNLLEDIISQVNQLFFKYPPVLLNGNIVQILTSLKQDGYTLNISSNTGFIEGFYLRRFLQSVKLDSFFDFAVFSDEINASKPSSGFYEQVYRKIKSEKHEVLHIGDNYLADFMGASRFGFNALLIENRDYSLELIKQTIDEKNRKF